MQVPVSFTTPNGSKPRRTEIFFKTDEGPRADISLEALLASCRRSTRRVPRTAGNSSQMSDGAAAAVVMSADRPRHWHQTTCAVRCVMTAGYKPEEMGLWAGVCIPKALKLWGSSCRTSMSLN